jgi:hypothetical protein
MEELQDAIEDAQYINAMQDDTPRPTKEWKFPSADYVESYVNNLTATRPIYVRPEGVCSGSLGLFMVSFCSLDVTSLQIIFSVSFVVYQVYQRTGRRFDVFLHRRRCHFPGMSMQS